MDLPQYYVLNYWPDRYEPVHSSTDRWPCDNNHHHTNLTWYLWKLQVLCTQRPIKALGLVGWGTMEGDYLLCYFNKETLLLWSANVSLLTVTELEREDIYLVSTCWASQGMLWHCYPMADTYFVLVICSVEVKVRWHLYFRRRVTVLGFNVC